MTDETAPIDPHTEPVLPPPPPVTEYPVEGGPLDGRTLRLPDGEARLPVYLDRQYWYALNEAGDALVFDEIESDPSLVLVLEPVLPDDTTPAPVDDATPADDASGATDE